LLSKSASELFDPITLDSKDSDSLKNIPVDLLQRGKYQPRVDIRQDTLQQLAESIRSQGVIQPIVVRPIKNSSGSNTRYEIIAGERRWRASQMAGKHEVPAIIRDIENVDAIAIALIENIQRENLNPLEEAKALSRLIAEFDITHKQAADVVGRSRVAVSNLLRLLDLSDEVKPMVEARQLEMGHARALLSLENPSQQLSVARDIIKRGLSVRATEKLIRGLLNHKLKLSDTKTQRDSNIKHLEKDISDKLGAKTLIIHTAKGSGKLVIKYNTLDELDGILKHIK
jgi:ParB family chromosome partitioning protein